MTDTELPHSRRLERAAKLKERIYLTFATLAVVAATAAHGHLEAMDVFLTVLVSVIGTLLAVFTADVLSHVVIHESLMNREELKHAASTSFGALGAVILPLAFLFAATLGWWDVEAALLAAGAALLVALMLIGYVAVRRMRLAWWQRLLALGAEAALGLIVLILQIMAKG